LQPVGRRSRTISRVRSQQTEGTASISLRASDEGVSHKEAEAAAALDTIAESRLKGDAKFKKHLEGDD
jgi:hypothetical protein